jgi:hypothetical protein
MQNCLIRVRFAELLVSLRLILLYYPWRGLLDVMVDVAFLSLLFLIDFRWWLLVSVGLQ